MRKRNRMRNWFTELRELRKSGSREEFPAPERLQPFADFLGRPEAECLIMAWLCMNHKKGDAQAIGQLFEQLGAKATHEELSEALVDLMTAGWVQASSEDFNDSSYDVSFTHRVEVALRSGNNAIFNQKIHPKERRDRSVLRMYAYAVLFKSKITDIDAWVEIGHIFLEYSEHELAQVIRMAKLDKFTQSVVLYIYVMHAVEGSHTEWRYLSELFSENRIAARRLLDLWNKPSWKPIRCGMLESRQFPMGPTMLYPAESCQRKIYGLADDMERMDDHLPNTLQRISAEKILQRALFYNPVEAEQIDMIRRMLRPAAFKKYKRSLEGTGEPTGIAVLLSGGPGTGKTELVRQLARETGRDLLLFNVAEQRDKFFGESEKRIKQTFDSYNDLLITRPRAPILFFNEGDSIFQNRQSIGSSTSSSENAIQTILLNELERFEGILFCTTNRPGSFDEAFARRFLFKVDIQPPTEPVRFQLLTHLFKKLPAAFLKQVAESYVFTAAELENFKKLHHMKNLVDPKQPDLKIELERYLSSITHKPTSHIGFRI